MTEPLAALRAALAGRYTIERELGRGGMATVYLARDLKHDRAVAIKVLRSDIAEVLGAERFLKEIRVTANLQHPHLLPLFDSGDADGLLFYVMPFVNGESLRARIDREGQLPIDEAIRIARDVASALDYAHRNGIVHRDLKPENLLLQDGNVLIADFGIALALSSIGGERLTQSGIGVGTPHYMSPEQAAGERVLDARTDIYSLGVVLYEMLAGEPPHTGKTAQAIIARTMNEQARPVTSLRPRVPVNVDGAIARALEKLPADRFSSAATFAQALISQQAETPLAPRPKRSRATDPVVFAMGVLTVASIAVAILAIRRGADERAPVIPLIVDLPLPVSIAIASDGLSIAIAGHDPGGTTRMYFKRVEDDESRIISGTNGASHVFFSPDGKSIGFYRDGGGLESVSLETGRVEQLANLPGVYGGTWSPNGDIIVSHRARLVRIARGGGEPQTLTSENREQHDFQQTLPVALADGDHVLYSSRDDSGSPKGIGVVSLLTGKSGVIHGVAPGLPLGMVDEFLIFRAAEGARTSGAAVVAQRVDLDGHRAIGDQVPLVTDIESLAVALSYSGSLVFLKGSPISRLVFRDINNAETPFAAPDAAFRYPRFSPDGTHIAVSIHDEIWTYDVKTAVPNRLYSDKPAQRPEWSYDSRNVLFNTLIGTRPDGRPIRGILSRPRDMSAEATTLIVGELPAIWEGVMTADGRQIVYQVDGLETGQNADIRIRSVNGDTTSIGIATTSANEDSGRPSPDNRWVAYTSNESGQRRVYVRSITGQGGVVPVSPALGFEPIWALDGKRLFYRSSSSIVEVTYSSNASFTVVSQKPLFDDVFAASPTSHANYDISPDGRRFLLVKRIGESSLRLIHNWATAVRERLKGAQR